MRKRTNKPRATTAQCVRLYEAARRYRAAKPWRVLADSDLVAVTDPATGVDYYCSVMGNAGMEFGLLAFRGERGLRCYVELAEESIDRRDLAFRLDGLAVEFGPKRILDKEDLRVVGELGLTLRGKHAWPQFRNHDPGRVPWYLTPRDAGTLIVCLEQVVGYLEDEAGSMMLESSDGRVVVPRRYQAVGSDGIEWRTELEEIRWPEPSAGTPLQLDDGTRTRLARGRVEPGMSWDVALLDLPVPVTDEEPPYFPLLPVVADSGTGFIMQTSMVKRSEAEVGDACREIVATALNCERLPETLRMYDKRLFEALAPVCDHADIKLQLVNALPAIEEFRQGLKGFLAKRR
jgi:hypothetical protein